MPTEDEINKLAKTLVEKSLAPNYQEAIVLAKKFLEMDQGSMAPELSGKSVGEASAQNQNGSEQNDVYNENSGESQAEPKSSISETIGKEVHSENAISIKAEGDNMQQENASEKPAIVGEEGEKAERGAASLYAFVKYYEGISMQKTEEAFEVKERSAVSNEAQNQAQAESHGENQQIVNQQNQGVSQQASGSAGEDTQKRREDPKISISDFFNVNRLPGKNIPKRQ